MAISYISKVQLLKSDGAEIIRFFKVKIQKQAFYGFDFDDARYIFYLR